MTEILRFITALMTKRMTKTAAGFFSCFLISPAPALLQGDASGGVSREASEASREVPFFWSAEKEGKTIHLLGTIHSGAALEDIACSDKIFERLKASDLVFLETEHKLIRILPEDQYKKLVTGSKNEREAIFSRLSPEVREEARAFINDTNKTLLELIIKPVFFPVPLIDRKKEPLSPAAAEFLISRGIDISGSFADYVYETALSAYYEAFHSSSKKMEWQIAFAAEEADIQIAALDDRSKTAADVDARETAPQAANPHEVTLGELERIIMSFGYLASRFRADMESFAPYYLKADRAYLQKIVDYGDDEEREILVKNRNKLWLKKILDAFEGHKRRRVFAAGGLAHFIGQANLLEMLKEEGFIVRGERCE